MQEPQYRGDVFGEEPENNEPGPPTKEKDSFLSFLGELPVLILTAIVVAWLIKSFVIQPFYIPSSSMEPTLLPGDRVLVSKFMYRFTQPKPNDVVVFVAPESRDSVEQDFIKRIVATAGMNVQVVNGKLVVNDKTRDEPFTRADNPTANYGPIIVPQGRVFVMGDNRANSRDSRFFGPVEKKELIGRAFFVYWPLNRAGMLR